MTQIPPLPSSHGKRATMQACLDQGDLVRVYLRTDHPGVGLPQHLYARPAQVLEVGYGLPRPIRDLALNPEGFVGVFSFGGVEEWCAIPWGAVFGLQVAARDWGQVWAEDAPRVEMSPEEREAQRQSWARSCVSAPPPPEPAPAPRRVLPAGWRVIQGGAGVRDGGPNDRGVA